MPRILLRWSEQLVLAVFILAGLVTTAGWWIAHGGLHGRMVEIDRAAPQTAKFQVDVNKAEWPELAELPGVGAKLAQRIVASRQQNGPYHDNNDLRRVNGIGPRTLEGMRPFLRPLPSQEAVAGP